jgi:hypothetical protein
MKHLIFVLSFIIFSTNLTYSQKNGFLLDSLVSWELVGQDTLFTSISFAEQNKIRDIGFSVRFSLLKRKENNVLSIIIKVVGNNMCFKYNERINIMLLNKDIVNEPNRKPDNCEGDIHIYFSEPLRNLEKIEKILNSNIEVISIGHSKPPIIVSIHYTQRKNLNQTFRFLAKRMEQNTKNKR